MCAEILDSEVILSFDFLEENVYSLSAIDHLLMTEETLFIFVFDVKGIETILDVLLKVSINLHSSAFPVFFS